MGRALAPRAAGCDKVRWQSAARGAVAYFKQYVQETELRSIKPDDFPAIIQLSGCTRIVCGRGRYLRRLVQVFRIERVVEKSDAHFVGRLLAVGDQLRWLAWIVRVCG